MQTTSTSKMSPKGVILSAQSVSRMFSRVSNIFSELEGNVLATSLGDTLTFYTTIGTVSLSVNLKEKGGAR